MTWFLADVGALFLSIVFVGLRGGWGMGDVSGSSHHSHLMSFLSCSLLFFLESTFAFV